MIELQQGDILKAPAEALVNTVNCVGVMGRGIALQFRKAFPENFKTYKAACDQGQLQPGVIFVHDLGRLTHPRYILNFPTKKHWRGKSQVEYIDSGLEDLAQVVRRLKISSVAIPPLGCGLGGLDWAEVRPKIEAVFAKLPEVRALLYEPRGAPSPSVMAKTARAPRMTSGRAALLELMSRYLAGWMDPFISLLEIHKLMYFMQEAGEPLKLRYTKGLYGPYAENLRHVLTHIEGHFIEGYADAGDNPNKKIELISSAVARAKEFLVSHRDTQDHCRRVAALVDGFESPFGMELLATVHWVAMREGALSPDEAVTKTHSWNNRKKIFAPEQITLAWKALEEKAWLP